MQDNDNVYSAEGALPQEVNTFRRVLGEMFDDEVFVEIIDDYYEVRIDELVLQFNLDRETFTIKDIIVSEYDLAIGSRTLDSIIEFCEIQGIEEIIAEDVQDESIEFWEKKGFTPADNNWVRNLIDNPAS